jgi:hypothetical protein
LNSTVAAFEKNACVVGSTVGRRWAIDERQAVALRTEAGESLDEMVLAKTEMSRDGGGLVGVDFHKAGPAAAIRAALAGVLNGERHESTILSTSAWPASHEGGPRNDVPTLFSFALRRFCDLDFAPPASIDAGEKSRSSFLPIS